MAVSPKSRKSSIHDVARAADVSLKTVSRVLNDEANVRPETAKRVREAASRLGYSVTLAARQLRSGRSRNIGIILVSRSHWQWTADLVAGALESCQERGYGLQPFVLTDYSGSERETLLQMIERRAVDGLVLTTPWSELGSLRDELVARDFPHVLVPAPVNSRSLGVRANERAGMASLVRSLLGLGHRRFAILAGQQILDGTQERLAGFKSAMTDAGLRHNNVPSIFRDYYFETGYRGALELLRAKKRPTAIIAFTDVVAAGALRAAAELGLKVPTDLSVAGVGNYDIASMLVPRLSTVAIPSQDMTARAVTMLIAAIEQTGDGVREIVFDTKLIIRESTGPVRA